jgi:hypothetical protein
MMRLQWISAVVLHAGYKELPQILKTMSGKIFFHYTSKLNTFCVLANRTTFNVGNVFLETMPISLSAMVAKMLCGGKGHHVLAKSTCYS